MITRALGTDDAVEVDTFTVRAKDGDVVLLCSDGLNTMVPEGTIADVLAAAEPAATIARNLVRAALAGGGEDNVTAIVFRVGEVADRARRTRRPRPTEPHPAGGPRPTEDDGDGLRLRLVVAVIGAVVLAARAGRRDRSSGCARATSSGPTPAPAGWRSTRACRSTCRSASTSTTSSYESTVSYASLTARERQTLFDHTLRSDSSALATLHPYEVASP